MERSTFGIPIKDNHEMSELELFRRELLNKEGYIEILQNNVRDLQEQLQNSYKRIDQLNQELENERKSKIPRVVSGIDGSGNPY
jgi:peptidoglycan hydrolase CwlO-like protein